MRQRPWTSGRSDIKESAFMVCTLAPFYDGRSNSLLWCQLHHGAVAVRIGARPVVRPVDARGVNGDADGLVLPGGEGRGGPRAKGNPKPRAAAVVRPVNARGVN